MLLVSLPLWVSWVRSGPLATASHHTTAHSRPANADTGIGDPMSASTLALPGGAASTRFEATAHRHGGISWLPSVPNMPKRLNASLSRVPVAGVIPSSPSNHDDAGYSLRAFSLTLSSCLAAHPRHLLGCTMQRGLYTPSSATRIGPMLRCYTLRICNRHFDDFKSKQFDFGIIGTTIPKRSSSIMKSALRRFLSESNSTLESPTRRLQSESNST